MSVLYPSVFQKFLRNVLIVIDVDNKWELVKLGMITELFICAYIFARKEREKDTVLHDVPLLQGVEGS